MKLSTNYKIAAVHLTSKVKQTIVALLGVTFGITVYIFMNSFLGGVNDSQTKLAFTTMAHVHIYNDGPADNTNLVKKAYGDGVVARISNAKVIQYTEGIKNSSQIIDLVKKQPEVVDITSQVNTNVFFRNGAVKINGTISGVEVANEAKMFGIADYMTAGNWNQLAYQPNGIILGSDLAHDLSVNINDNVNILTPEGVSHNYKLIGVFQTYIKNVDKTKAYLNINTVRQLKAKNQDYVTDLQINVADFEVTKPTVAVLKPAIPYVVESWQDANQQLEAGSRLRSIIAKAVSLTILLVAGFGIYNIMNMTINEKIREIAILKAMGFASRDITTIFLTQAIIIGLLGGAVGLLLGFTVASLVERVPFQLGGLQHLPMNYEFKVYGMAFCFGMLTTLIAGYLPARKASKIDPVNILRG